MYNKLLDVQGTNGAEDTTGLWASFRSECLSESRQPSLRTKPEESPCWLPSTNGWRGEATLHACQRSWPGHLHLRSSNFWPLSAASRAKVCATLAPLCLGRDLSRLVMKCGSPPTNPPTPAISRCGMGTGPSYGAVNGASQSYANKLCGTKLPCLRLSTHACTLGKRRPQGAQMNDNCDLCSLVPLCNLRPGFAANPFESPAHVCPEHHPTKQAMMFDRQSLRILACAIFRSLLPGSTPTDCPPKAPCRLRRLPSPRPSTWRPCSASFRSSGRLGNVKDDAMLSRGGRRVQHAMPGLLSSFPCKSHQRPNHCLLWGATPLSPA